MTRSCQPRVVSAILAALFVLGVGGISGAVLCISGEHVAVEIVDSMRCHPEYPAGDDGCPEACQDTPLAGGPVLRGDDLDACRALAAASAIACAQSLASISPRLVERSTPPPTHGVAFSLPFIRTVVLRC